MLDAFRRKLCAHQRSEIAEATEDQKKSASGHGLQRWQQGYREREVMREWRHLHLCLVDELERYASDHPNLETSVLPAARRALAELCSDGVCESAGQYARLQRAEAAGRVRDLESALDELSELGKRRRQTWHEAAHDLRGSVAVVTNVSKFLTNDDLSQPERARFAAMLQRGVTSLHSLLNDLLGLARLEAGQEQREVAPFDAAVLLNEICENMRLAAKERGLFLEAEGPPTLEVEGDRVKTYRLVQNLVSNALKYTEHGGVRVTWEPSGSPEVERWVLCVEDTGPGLRGSGAPAIAYALKEATKEAQSVNAAAEQSETLRPRAPRADATVSIEPPPVRGRTGGGNRPIDREATLRTTRREPGARNSTREGHHFPRRLSESVGRDQRSWRCGLALGSMTLGFAMARTADHGRGTGRDPGRWSPNRLGGNSMARPCQTATFEPRCSRRSEQTACPLSCRSLIGSRVSAPCSSTLLERASWGAR